MKESEKNNAIKFMVKYNINILNLIPTKPVLLEKIRGRNTTKQYVINSMVKKVSYDVLQLPPYHCVLNSFEMVWNQLNPLQPGVTFLYPLKTSENLQVGFLMFSAGIEKQHWAVIAYHVHHFHIYKSKPSKLVNLTL